MGLVTVLFGVGMRVVARSLTTPLQRLRGLLLTDAGSGPVLLEGCSSVHTFGMSYPIDVAFIGLGGACLLSERGVMPGRVLSARGAQYVLERPARDGPWPQRGGGVHVLHGGCPRRP